MTDKRPVLSLNAEEAKAIFRRGLELGEMYAACRAERAELIDNLRDAAEWIENATIGTQHMVPKVAKRARALLQRLDRRTEP